MIGNKQKEREILIEKKKIEREGDRQAGEKKKEEETKQKYIFNIAKR